MKTSMAELKKFSKTRPSMPNKAGRVGVLLEKVYAFVVLAAIGIYLAALIGIFIWNGVSETPHIIISDLYYINLFIEHMSFTTEGLAIATSIFVLVVIAIIFSFAKNAVKRFKYGNGKQYKIRAIVWSFITLNVISAICIWTSEPILRNKISPVESNIQFVNNGKAPKAAPAPLLVSNTQAQYPVYQQPVQQQAVPQEIYLSAPAPKVIVIKQEEPQYIVKHESVAPKQPIVHIETVSAPVAAPEVDYSENDDLEWELENL